MGRDLINQIAAIGIITAKWELSAIVNCYQGEGDALVKGNDRALKLTIQVLEIVADVEQFIRQQVKIDEMRFCFMPGNGYGWLFLRKLLETHLSKKKNLYFQFVGLGQGLDRMARNVVW